MSILSRLLSGTAVVVVAASVATGVFADEAKKSLYDRLGGLDALKAVVGELWVQASSDERIKARFANTDPAVFGGQLVDFLCVASGGPCEYKGKDMKAAHTGMGLTEAEFNALAEDVVKSLDKFSVPEAEKGEVMALLGGLMGDVVGH